MRLDVVTIFPEYLAPLDLSLIGRARRDGLLDLHVHDLRDFAHDRHRTVDDTPFGGGAGMVMKPQPWSEALTHVAAQSEGRPRLIVPGPGGRPFTQADAHRLAAEPWLAFACGRYEGIDERVYDWAAERTDVEIVSLGDYVLNGGEVAVLAIVEAVARLLPGVVGNAQSLVEESHEDGLLEYPVYTKPASWHGRDVPPVLLSGDHGAIAAWRLRQRLKRTAARRPDLLPPQAFGLDDIDMRPAVPADAGELHTLTRACWLAEVQAVGYADFPAVTESAADAVRDLSPGTPWSTWVGRLGPRLVAAVRAREIDGAWHIGRLMVAPDLQGRGIGRGLLAFVEAQAPAGAREVNLVAGAASARNLKMYKKAGYRQSGPWEVDPRAVWLRKRR